MPKPHSTFKSWLWRSFLAFCLVFASTAWIATSRLISPQRRALQDYHREILSAPTAHGLHIDAFQTHSKTAGETPCLLCEPAPNSPSSAKGLHLREQLSNAHVALPAPSSIIGTLVLLHGHTGRKEDMLPVAERFCAAGFRCLLLDLPGHGDHPLPFASFGKTERQLPSEVLHTASQQFHFTIGWSGLFGLSQGGAIALQTAAEESQQWQAVAEISSFADLGDVIHGKAQSLLGPFAPLLSQTVNWLCQCRAGYSPASIRPVEACSQIKALPVLIGHGEQDEFVPPAHASRLYDALPTNAKQRLAIKGAGHHNILVTPAPVYATVAQWFLSSALTTKTQPGEALKN